MRGEKERMKHENLSRAINCKALNKKKMMKKILTNELFRTHGNFEVFF